MTDPSEAPKGALPGPLPPLTVKQREKILAVTRRNKALGVAAIMRKAGLTGTRGQLKALVDDDFAGELREARGWNISAVEDVLWKVAANPEHPQWARAIQLLMRARGDQEFRDDLRRLEHTGAGGGPIQLLAGPFNPERLTTEQLEELKRLLEQARRDDDDGGELATVAQLPRR